MLRIGHAYRLANIKSVRRLSRMTIEQIKTAIREGIPFVLKMADGRRYLVSDEHRVALGKSFVMLVDEKDLPNVLPLRTMTSISYLASEGS